MPQPNEPPHTPIYQLYIHIKHRRGKKKKICPLTSLSRAVKLEWQHQTEPHQKKRWRNTKAHKHLHTRQAKFYKLQKTETKMCLDSLQATVHTLIINWEYTQRKMVKNVKTMWRTLRYHESIYKAYLGQKVKHLQNGCNPQFVSTSCSQSVHNANCLHIG